MSANVKSKTKLQRFYNRKALTFVSLLFTVMFVSSCFVPMFSSISPFASGAPNIVVNNEAELKDAVNNAVEPAVITLGRDITLTEQLTILDCKDITLASNNNKFFKLIGTDECSAIGYGYYPTLNIHSGGVLRLDGIVVTHANGTSGCGVYINSGGTLILSNGKISGNSVTNMFGGGVCNYGSFSMSGGEISGNTAESGGGVFNRGSFSMSGGEISGNTADYYGGGVYNRATYSDISVFTMTGGIITNNLASRGGGVANHGDVFSLSGGEIFRNKADAHGGGVFNYEEGTFKMSGGKISSNTAIDMSGGVLNSGSFSMSGGKISDNIARFGGGVTNLGNFSLRGGIVFGNTAPNGNNIYGDGAVDYFGVRDTVVIYVSAIIVTVSVITGILFVYLKKRNTSCSGKIEQIC